MVSPQTLRLPTDPRGLGSRPTSVHHTVWERQAQERFEARNRGDYTVWEEARVEGVGPPPMAPPLT